MNDIKIVKKDGETEPFMFDKLLASITKTGIEVDDAQKIADEVCAWIKDNATNKEMDSRSIRDKVIEVLSKEHPAEADSFKAYKKE